MAKQSMDMQKTQITRFVGSVKDLKEMESGDSVLNFSIPVNYSYQKDGEWQDTKTVWWQIAVWNEDAERLDGVLQTGDTVTIEYFPTDLSTRAWKDDGGKAKSEIKVKAQSVIITHVKESRELLKQILAERRDDDGYGEEEVDEELDW